MSHRTILEFNHDYIHDMENDPTFWPSLLRKLKGNDFKDRYTPAMQGVRKVGERHHGQDLVIEVGGFRSDPQ